MNYFVPILLIFLLILSFKKKVNAYSSFCHGAKNGIKLTLNLLPFVVAIMLMISLMQISGVTSFFCHLLSPILSFFGIPIELTEFICIRPLTGSGSLALLTNIVNEFGTENYVSKCACLIMSTTETTFFSSALYFSKTKNANTTFVLALSLFLSFLAMTLSCFACSLIFK